MDLIDFDPKVRHMFVFGGQLTSLIEGDVVLLKEMEDGGKKSARFGLLFVRQNAFIHVDGGQGIRVDPRAHFNFDWMAGVIALISGCDSKPYNPEVKAVRLVKQSEGKSSP